MNDPAIVSFAAGTTPTAQPGSVSIASNPLATSQLNDDPDKVAECLRQMIGIGGSSTAQMHSNDPSASQLQAPSSLQVQPALNYIQQPPGLNLFRPLQTYGSSLPPMQQFPDNSNRMIPLASLQPFTAQPPVQFNGQHQQVPFRNPFGQSPMFGRNWMIMTGNNPMISMPPSSITPPSMPNFYHDIPQHQPYEQYHPSQGPPNYQQQQFMSTAPIHRLPAQPNSNLSQQQQFDLQQQMHRQTSAVSNPSWPLDGQQTQNAQLIQSSNRSQQRPQQPQRQQRPCSPSNKSSADGAVNNRENFDKEKARQELLVGLQTLLDRRPFPPTRFLDGPMTEQIEQYCAALEPLREDFDKHQKAVQFIQSILVRTFDKDCVVHQFGSTANGLCLRGAADMDVCIELSAAQRIACEEQRSIKEQAIMAEWEAAAVAAAAEQAEAEAETESFDEKEKISKSATDKGPQQQQHQPEISGETIPENEQAAAEGEEKKERRRKPKPLSLAQFVLSRLAEELEKENRCVDLMVLVNTRIPIVKFKDLETNMHIDVGFDNLLAVHNTRLLRTYSRIDPRFRQMVMIVKHWAKQRSINDTYSGTLSSYAYVVMVVHFLQYACEPPILPCLQRLPPDGRNEILLTVGGNSDETDRQQQQMFNIYFLEDLDQLDRWWPWRGRNHTSIGRLLYLFFHYWSYEFDYKNSVASIRTGGLMTKDEKNWVPLLEQQSAAKKEEEGAVEVGKSSQSDPPALEQEMLPSATEGADQKQNGDDKQQTEPATVKKERLQRYWVCIEDPFECTHNLGRPVGRDSLYFIRGEFLKACGILTNPKHYPRQYVQALYQGLASVVDAPPLLRLLCEETTYKTREEHKQRNKENREFSDKRRGSETADRQEKKSGSTAPAATKSDDNSTKMQPVSGKSADKPAAAAKQQQPQQQQQKPAQKQQKQKQKQSSNNSGEIKGASKEFAGTAIKSPLSPSATDPRKSDNNKERKRPPQHKQKKN